MSFARALQPLMRQVLKVRLHRGRTMWNYQERRRSNAQGPLGIIQYRNDWSQESQFHQNVSWRSFHFSETQAEQMLSRLSPDEKDQLQFLKTEYDAHVCNMNNVPPTPTSVMWMEMLLNLQEGVSVGTRTAQWRFYALKERHRIKKEVKKLEKSQLDSENESDGESTSDMDTPKEDTVRNTLFLHLFTADKNIVYFNNIYHARMHGAQIVFDCSFEDTMNQREIRSLVRQFILCHSFNKVQADPFYFNFCNLDPQKYLWDRLTYSHSGDRNCDLEKYDNLPYAFTENNYLDIFPKEKLVVLSPDGQRSLNRVDPDLVYVIGAITDRGSKRPLTKVKAKREGIAFYKLPLDFVQVDLFEHHADVTPVENVPQQAVGQVFNPFVLTLLQESEATLKNGVKIQLSAKKPCWVHAYWGVKIESLYPVIYSEWPDFVNGYFNTGFMDSICLASFEQIQINPVVDEKMHLRPYGNVQLGPPPRERYPLVTMVVDLEAIEMPLEEVYAKQSIVSMITLFHVRDDLCPAQTHVFAQYVRTASGQPYNLKPLYMSDDSEVLSQPSSCVVCQSAPVQRVILPCRHTCVCHECFHRMEFCPMCRGSIVSYFMLTPGTTS